jgi:hypothetical protein
MYPYQIPKNEKSIAETKQILLKIQLSIKTTNTLKNCKL